MGNLKIETTQNVFIEYNTASVGERMLAQAIDLLIFGGYLYLVGEISDFVSYKQKNLYFSLLSIPILTYSIICELAFNGQSFGKMLLKIKVVKIDGTLPTFSSYFLRWIFRLIDVWFMWGIVATITIITNGRGQRLGDIVAKTTVISLKTKEKMTDTIHTFVNEEYEIKFQEVNLLTDEDITTVKEVLNHYRNNAGNDSVLSILQKARQAIEKKMNIEPAISMSPFEFLQTVLKDYNHYHKTL